ncbi:E3 ubiquitin-protein ligase MSL2-like [Centruroides sculpturatus]|uniref:E3 ubiquitin-protein ligase MSL2-like n=1 Tax=Centruroides sculpturatus TaxID=218467 RepID=UPI000C6E4D56|nr:E3 ubiquitin-protein ligase MSL2-like [Centruroides sculpturatus]
MNALSLYVRTCRRILQWSGDEHPGDIDRLLLFLRQALSCCVCDHLPVVPMSSTTSSCQHSVCKSCIGGKMKIKPSCSWCKDYSKYSENTHLRILLQLYKKLCEYCASVSLPLKFSQLSDATNVDLAELVREGVSLPDSAECLPSAATDGATSQQLPVPPPPVVNGETKELSNGVYSVTVSEDNSNKIMIKRTAADVNNEVDVSCKKSRSSSSFRSAKSRLKKKGCRCGLATPNPGKLTCCGQRCPCYVGSKACYECRCRGCRNPHKAEDVDQRGEDATKSRQQPAQNEDTSDVDVDG